MAEDLRMDSHKLIFHPLRVSEWLNGKDIYPLTVEVSPAGTCNHRCIFCGLDYLGYKSRFLDKDLIIANLEEMYSKGVKAIVVAGEGEPLLNPDTPTIINRGRAMGLDMGMASNGVFFTRQLARQCLPSLSWIRFSVNAANPDIYRMVHRGKEGDFSKVLQNIADAVEVKKSLNLNTTIGVQLVLLPENNQELLAFAVRLKDMGIDYFAIKPFSQHPQSHSSINPDFDYAACLEMEEQFETINSSEFLVIFRTDSMRKLSHNRNYKRCLGIPFWAYIDANAKVWPCLAYIGKADFCLGDLKQKSFASIWESDHAKELLQKISQMDIGACRELCRLDSINEYLHQLVNPGAHVNFI